MIDETTEDEHESENEVVDERKFGGAGDRGQGGRMTPSFEQQRYSRALSLLWDEGRPAAAVSELREALRLQPDLAPARESLGDALAQLGRDDEAIAAYREALRLEPANLRVCLELGVLLELNGRWGEEAALYRTALSHAPSDPVLHHRLGGALIRDGQIEEGMAAYQEADRLNPGSRIDWNLEMAWELQRAGRLDGVLTLYRHLTLTNPNEPRARLLLAEALRRAGEPDEAAREFHAAALLEPENRKHHFLLGMTLRDAGRPEEALAAFRNALRLDPNNPVILWPLSHCLEAAGRSDEAADTYREIIRLVPDDLCEIDPAADQVTLRAQAHARLAALLQAQGRLSEASAERRQAERLRPGGGKGMQGN
jgi:Flp pilus assembly protein TadD